MSNDGAPTTSGLVVETANDRFKKSSASWFWASMIAAVVVHFAVFSLFPEMYAKDVATVTTELENVNMQPEIELPPPPERIQRPARPVISDAVLNQDITIMETTFEALPEVLPPPAPIKAAAVTVGGPQFTPYDEDPYIKNRDEIQSLLQREYPQVLRQAGITGTVLIYFHISETGEVLETQLAESSGHTAMDEAALRIAALTEFAPAKNLLKTVAVWVQLPIAFTAG